VRGPNYSQRWLLPPSVDEWVPKGHPVRFVRDFVDAVDLSKHGIAEPKGERGRPPVAADVLLTIWLYGFTQRIRSTRQLEKACVERLPFLWLTGNDAPDHNTIWRFFKTNSGALKGLFKTLMQSAAEANLVSFVLHALDGTKLQATSSTDGALHRKSVEEKLKLLDEVIDQFAKEVEATVSKQNESDGAQQMPKEMQDVEARRQKIRELLAQRIDDRKDGRPEEPRAAEPIPLQPAKDEPPAAAETASPPALTSPAGPAAESTDDPLASEAKALKSELEAKLAKLDAAGEKHLSEQELDARMMKGRAMHALGYNAQIVVDHDSDMIVACDVSAQANDLKQLTPMLGQVQETYGRVADETTADGGYCSGMELARAEEKGLPVIVRLREEPESKGGFSKAHFRYDAENNVYICPLGEKLIQIGTNRAHPSAEPDTIYQCKDKTCPRRSECSGDPRGRKIRRPPGEDARERQAQKQQEPRSKILLGLRKEIVEHLFGIIKTVDGFRRFTVCGLKKVRAQWALVCLGVNLRKLAAVATWRDGRLVPLIAAEG